MQIVQYLSSRNWIPYFKPVAQAYGSPDPAIILSELANRQQFHQQRGELTPDGFFYVTVEKIEQETTLSKHKQSIAINRLKADGLIEAEIKGMPAKRHFRFPEDFDIKLANFLTASRRIIGQQVGEKFAAIENPIIENTPSLEDGPAKEKKGESPPGCAEPPHGLPPEEQKILEALEKAKAFFDTYPAMKEHMIRRAKAEPGQLDLYLQLEQWVRHNSQNAIFMQDPARKINSDFQRWLTREATYAARRKTKNNNAPQSNEADKLQQDRRYYGKPEDDETW